MPAKFITHDCSLARLTIVAEDGYITNISFSDKCLDETCAEDIADPLLTEAARQIDEYLAGKRTTFALPLNPKGTIFMKKVWTALTQIPYGETRTYKQIAAATGNEKACRAIGMINHLNPIAIAIPCHRVIGANGKLTGYAGGLDIKTALLKLESQNTVKL